MVNAVDPAEGRVPDQILQPDEERNRKVSKIGNNQSSSLVHLARGLRQCFGTLFDACRKGLVVAPEYRNRQRLDSSARGNSMTATDILLCVNRPFPDLIVRPLYMKICDF